MARLADQLPHRDAARQLAPPQSRLQRLKARRKLWLEVHLWLGLVAGAALVLIGLTGSVLVFWQELDAALNPSLYRVAAGAQPLPLSQLGEVAKAALPEGAKVGWVDFPKGPDDPLTLYYDSPNAAGQTDSWMLFIDPHSGHVNGTRLWYPADYFSSEMPLIAFLFKLHYALLLKGIGVPVVGILAVLLLFSVLTGLIVWWPLTGKFRQALSFKPRSSKERFNFDLHKTSGFYTSVVLFAVLLSGVSMNLPEQFNAGVRLFSTVTSPADFRSQPAPGRERAPWHTAAERVDAAWPEGRLASIAPPDGDQGVLAVCKTDILSLGRFVNNRCAFVDQYNGAILKMADMQNGSGGDVFLQWQWPLHSGRAFGWPGRILVFLSGLACPVLYVTGFIRWLQKRKPSPHNPL